MMAPEQLQSMIGKNAVDADGDKIGRIGQIYLDDSTGEPQWVTVSTGMFGTKESFAPLYNSRTEGDNLMLAVSKAMVKDAPNVDNDGHLEESEVQALYDYYGGYLGNESMMGQGGMAGDSMGQGGMGQGGMGQGGMAGDSMDQGTMAGAGMGQGGMAGDSMEQGTMAGSGMGQGGMAGDSMGQGTMAGAGMGQETMGRGAMGDREDLTGDAGVVGHDTSGPTTDDAMTRSEEQVRVGTQRVEAGRARLRKYIVTEDVTQTVPVSHEEVRLEREPITEANMGQAMSGGDLTEEEHEVTLHAEQPVVEKETVPVERVRLATETVTGEETVNEQVRKEHIEDPQTDNRGDRR
jgi:uncharacterized protein (TIGR02271 family)